MKIRSRRSLAVWVLLGCSGLVAGLRAHVADDPAAWIDDLSPIPVRDWSAASAAHLLERAGFGATPDEIARVVSLTPALSEVPTIPDFGRITASLGQSLFDPPNVAGWAGGRTWITPSTLLERGNLFRGVLFPDVKEFRPPDRSMSPTDARVGQRLSQGMGITEATKEDDASETMAESNMMVDRDEEYNTRYGGYKGLLLAFERTKQIPRRPAALDGRADQVAVMIFTEFGRRVEENGSLGTDHGTATPMFIVGKGVKGGFYGQHPRLTDLDDGNMKMTTDFRSVYATMIKEWLGYDDTPAVLRGRFEPLGVFA